MKNIVYISLLLFLSSFSPVEDVKGFPFDENAIDPFIELRNQQPQPLHYEDWSLPMYATYYVAANGSSSNSGTSEASPWSFTHAVSQAQAGDVVFVKAGNYGNTQLTFSNSGNSSSPVRFIGYKITPNDIISEEGSTIKDENSVSSTEMPYFYNSDISNTYAFVVSGDYIHIENMQVEGYEIAYSLQSQSSYCVLNNVVAKEQGDMTLQSTDSSHPDRYRGEGIRVSGTNHEILNYALYNPEQQGLAITGGSYNYIHDGYLKSYNSINGIDYFCLTTGGASYNIFDNNTLYRVAGIQHNGHGFVAKSNAEYNVYRNSEVYHTSVCEVNSQGIRYNLFQNLKSYGTFDQLGNGGDEYGFIYIFNGANNNRFDRVWVDNAWHFVMFFDNNEGPSSNVVNGTEDGGIARNSGNNNWFTNCVGTRNGNAIYINENNGSASPTYDNHFIGCTFVDIGSYFLQARSANSGFDIRNVLLHNVSNSIQETGGFTFNPSTFSHINKSGSGFSASQLTSYGGTNLTSITPSFENISTYDLRMTNANLDIGLAISDPNYTIDGTVYTTIGNDFLGNARTGARTIGAYEYGATTTTPPDPEPEPTAYKGEGAMYFLKWINN